MSIYYHHIHSTPLSLETHLSGDLRMGGTESILLVWFFYLQEYLVLSHDLNPVLIACNAATIPPYIKFIEFGILECLYRISSNTATYVTSSSEHVLYIHLHTIPTVCSGSLYRFILDVI